MLHSRRERCNFANNSKSPSSRGSLLYIDHFPTGNKSSDRGWRVPAKCTTNGENVSAFTLSSRTTLHRVEDGHFVLMEHSEWIPALVPDSVRYYCDIDSKSTILVSRCNKTRNQGGRYREKYRTRKENETKVGVILAVSNPHLGKAPCGAVPYRMLSNVNHLLHGHPTLRHAENSVFIQL